MSTEENEESKNTNKPKPRKSHFEFKENRFTALNLRLQEVEEEIERIKSTGAVAPPGCWVVRYLTKGQGNGIVTTEKGMRYPYYELQAKEPIFENEDGKLRRTQHLGKAGCPDHIQALQRVSRRRQIEILKQETLALEKALDDLILERTPI